MSATAAAKYDAPDPAPQRAARGVAGIAYRLRRNAADPPRRTAIALIAILLAALLAALAWPLAKTHLQAVAVLDLVANRPVPAMLQKLFIEPVATRDLSFATSQGVVRARLYTPQDQPNAPALVVLHGVHHLGIDEPRLMAFAAALSSCGLRVLTPELPDIKDYHVGANSIATIGESAAWFSGQTGGHPVGVMGLSFSGGLALVAAADPRFHRSIKFVVAIGSQDEMSRVAQYYRTGADARPNGSEELLPPHEYGALVLEYEDLADFVPAVDIAPLRAVLRAHLYEDRAGEKAALAALSSAQLAEATQLMNTTSTATRAALARSGAKHISAMASVSPHGHLSHLTTPVYLLAGTADNIIPSAETLWMEHELPRKTLHAALISPVLSHLDLDGAGPTALDRWRLVHFFAEVLHAAEAR